MNGRGESTYTGKRELDGSGNKRSREERKM